MKRYVFFITLLIVLSGCNKENGDETQSEKTYVYTEEFVLDNRTDKQIEVINNYPESMSWDNTTIVADESERFLQYAVWLGACFFEELLQDVYPDEDMRLLVTNGGTQAFSITVDSEKVSDDVWLRKHWEFTPGYTTWTYTLTVTDELLEQLRE